MAMPHSAHPQFCVFYCKLPYFLELNVKKYTFLQLQVRFLGHLLIPGGNQLKAVKVLPLRERVKDVRRRVGEHVKLQP